MSNLVRITGGLLSSSKTKSARAWIDRGAKVLALHGVNSRGKCDYGKVDCPSPGKHPIASEFPNGQHSATTIKAKITKVLKRHPNANLGVVLPDDIVVLDVDGPDGLATYEQLNLPKTATVQTGRGTHHYFRTDAPLPKKKIKLDGIDIKDSKSGYIVVPPGEHKSGKSYKWKSRLKRNRVVAELPRSFLDQISQKPSTKTVNFDHAAKVTKGGRNNTLASYAGYFRHKAMSAEAIDNVLSTINDEICSPPLGDNEASRIAHSIGNYDHGEHEDAFGSLADVEEAKVEFLAYPYIVKGATTVLDGNMGQGKSTFTAALAAAVTTGNIPPFLDEIEQGNVLFLSAEDDAARVLKPRLNENGADVSKVRYQEKVFSLDADGMLR